jgi:alpha-galactosidase
MKKKAFIHVLVFLAFLISCSSSKIETGKIEFKKYWKFSKGDNISWSKPGFDDSKWDTIPSGTGWNDIGLLEYDGYGWYRTKIFIPSSLKKNHILTDSLEIDLGYIDNFNQVFLNGFLIGENHRTIKAGSIADTLFKNELNVNSGPRSYVIPTNDPRIHWDKENVVAIRIFDLIGDEGLFDTDQSIHVTDINDYIGFDNTSIIQFGEDSVRTEVVLKSNLVKTDVQGTLTIKVQLSENKSELFSYKNEITLKPGVSFEVPFAIKTLQESSVIHANFGVEGSLVNINYSGYIPYILTPKPGETPKINGAKVFGVRPGKPLMYKIAASGIRPMEFEAQGLPKGVFVDKKTGIISGRITNEGEYKIQISAINSKGEAVCELKIVAGDKLALTPPMGWNSWNCWGVTIDQDKMLNAGRVFVQKGLVNYGWSYIDIDDGWASPVRKANGEVSSNDKFPNIKALGDSLHKMGLKFGIYSSPGPVTCGNFLGAYLHEKQDAQTFAKWGVDLLKYDYCKYAYLVNHSNEIKDLQKPYFVMDTALRLCDRDIVYSLCQYGLGNVWEWGSMAGGNLWRTTGDIRDNWESLKEIGFADRKNAKYAGPGGWNDQDMLIVGRLGLGYGPDIHYTNLTPDEQYTHISLWVLQAAPLLIGCDLNYLDEFTLSLLTNEEVIAVDQDVLGKQAVPVLINPSCQVWIKELEDGSKAMGIFNMNDKRQAITLNLNDLGIVNKVHLRDLWRKKDLGEFENNLEIDIPSHGVVLLKVES